MPKRKPKPIRVFYSPLSERFYAAKRYRIDENGIVVVTGERYDVTQDIAHAIVSYDIEFIKKDPTQKGESNEHA
jgi:hypothetical protein